MKPPLQEIIDKTVERLPLLGTSALAIGTGGLAVITAGEVPIPQTMLEASIALVGIAWAVRSLR